MNVGLLLMTVVSILPIGILQANESITNAYWSARSAEFMQQDLMQTLRWLRIPGDIFVALGEVLFVLFVIGLHFGWSKKGKR